MIYKGALDRQKNKDTKDIFRGFIKATCGYSLALIRKMSVCLSELKSPKAATVPRASEAKSSPVTSCRVEAAGWYSWSRRAARRSSGMRVKPMSGPRPRRWHRPPSNAPAGSGRPEAGGAFNSPPNRGGDDDDGLGLTTPTTPTTPTKRVGSLHKTPKTQR